MSNRIVVSALAAIAIVVLAGTARAHHNMSAMFDFNDRVTLTGTLTKIDWRNPHIGLTVDVKSADNTMQSWAVEGPPPSFFRAREVNKTNVDAALGKSVTFEASRARDGSQSGLLRTMTLPDGAVLSACPQNC
jgi:hypothetical protein